MYAQMLGSKGRQVIVNMKWFRNHRTAAAGVCVRRLSARLQDRVKFGQLLRELPEAEELRPRLAAAFYARAWDPTAMRDLWIVSDGTHVDCYIISGTTLAQAAIRVRWDAKKRDISALSRELLADCVGKVTLETVTLLED